MKKTILIIVLTGFMLPVLAQRFHGGAMLGLAATQIDGDNLGGYNKPGIRGGGWVNTPVSESLVMQLELEFIQKGSKVSQNELKNKEYYHARLNYLQAPVLVQTSLMTRLTGEAGIAGAYLVASLEDDDGGGFIEADPPFDQFELSGLLGLNYELSEHFIANVRFNYSLLPVRPHPGNQSYWLDRGQFNNAMLFSLYYRID
ncbi:MAG: PorT family protein [Bacteroidales bacterium]|nr:PorT family protein [Bacteroidales bacterium]